MARLLSDEARGVLVEPTNLTVAEYLDDWLAHAHRLSPKTAERFADLIKWQIVPHLGDSPLQKLKPAQVARWHGVPLKGGGKSGRPLAARTVQQAHAVLRMAIAQAVKTEVVARNVCSSVSPPKIEKQEIKCLKVEQISQVLDAMTDHSIYPIVVLALSTGMRRGELLALRWGDVNLDNALVTVEQSLEQTKAGLRFKAPKTAYGRRTIALPEGAIVVLREHRRRQMEQRLQLGQGGSHPSRWSSARSMGPLCRRVAYRTRGGTQ